MKRMKATVLSSALALSMLITPMGYAANYDIKHKTDSAKNTSISDILDNDDKFDEVVDHIGDYLIEYDSKDYDLKAYDEKWNEMYQKNKKLVKEGKIKDEMIFGTKDLPEGAAPVEPLKPSENSTSELKVVSVSAINHAQIKVVYNKEVDKVSAETAANYTLSPPAPGDTAVIGGGQLQLQSDKKTVLINLTVAGTLQEKRKLTVKDVKDLADNKVVESTENIEFFDMTLPVPEKVEVVGTKTLKLTFSEPVHNVLSTASFKIDNGKYLDPAPTFVLVPGSAERNIVSLELAAALPVGEHTLTVAKVKDFANLLSASKDLTFNYKKDDTAPTISLDKVKEDAKTAVLKFSKDIDKDTLVNNANVLCSHTYKGGANEVDGTAITGSGNEYEIVFTNLMPPGNVNIFLYYKDGTKDKDKIKDLFGNIVELPVTLSATVVADTVAPTVEEVKAAKVNKIEVLFSEEVQQVEAEKKENYKLTDADDKEVAIASISYAAKKATITTTGDMKAGEHKLAIKNVKDKAAVPNTMAPVSKTFTVADLIAPTVQSAIYDATNKKIAVKFDKEMAPAGLADASSYGLSINTAAPVLLPAGAVITVKDTKTVEIVLPAAIPELVDGGADRLIVKGDLTDSAGNKLGDFPVSQVIQVAGNIQPNVIANSAKFIDTKTITFEVDIELKEGTLNPATIQYNGNNVAKATFVNSGGKAIVTVEVAVGDVLTQTNVAGFNNVTIAMNALESIYGGKNGALITINAADIKDEVAPFITTASKMDDTDGNGQIDEVQVVFSEDIEVETVQAKDFEISDGYKIEKVKNISGDTITLKLEESGTPDTGASITVSLVGEVEDVVGNVATDLNDIALVDEAKPVALSAKLYDGATNALKEGVAAANDYLIIEFSEEIDAASIDTTGPDAAGATDDAEIKRDAATFATANALNAATTVTASAGAEANQLKILFNAVNAADNTIQATSGPGADSDWVQIKVNQIDDKASVANKNAAIELLIKND